MFLLSKFDWNFLVYCARECQFQMKNITVLNVCTKFLNLISIVIIIFFLNETKENIRFHNIMYTIHILQPFKIECVPLTTRFDFLDNNLNHCNGFPTISTCASIWCSSSVTTEQKGLRFRVGLTFFLFNSNKFFQHWIWNKSSDLFIPSSMSDIELNKIKSIFFTLSSHYNLLCHIE